MISNKPPVLLFDLDGTLLSINSFPFWVKWMLKGRFPHLSATQRLTFFMQTAMALVWRKVARETHARFKQRLQLAWRSAMVADTSGACAEAFADMLMTHVRDNFRPLLATLAGGHYDAVLTTAAAEEYAMPLAGKLGFTQVICTRLEANPYMENLAETKRANTLLELQRLGWAERPRIFFTDHVDDMPLVKVCDQNFWLGNAASLEAAKRIAPNKSIEWVLNFEAVQMVALLPSLTTD